MFIDMKLEKIPKIVSITVIKIIKSAKKRTCSNSFEMFTLSNKSFKKLRPSCSITYSGLLSIMGRSNPILNPPEIALNKDRNNEKAN